MTGELDGLADVLLIAGRLKELRRQGWLHIGVPEPESVAEHSYRLALMTLLLGRGRPDIDLERALTLALIHDLPEAIAGDATPFDTLPRQDVDRAALFRRRPVYSAEDEERKRAAEERALETIAASLPADLARVVVDAWREYESGESAEARLVRQLDKLEALLQALEYRRRQPDLPVTSFRLGADAAVSDRQLRELLRAIDRRFDERWGGDEATT